MTPPFLGVHPVVIDWSVALVIGLGACMLIALIQEVVSFLANRKVGVPRGPDSPEGRRR